MFQRKCGGPGLADSRPAVNPTTGKKQSVPPSVQQSIRVGTGPHLRGLDGTSWFEQSLAGASYPSGPSLDSVFTDFVGSIAGIDDSGAATGFNGWEAGLEPFSSTSLDSFATPMATEATLTSNAPSTTDSRDDSEDVDDDKDPTKALSSQLASLSQRATRTMHRLVRPDRTPPTVSSPEVNEALEDTNALIRIVKKLTSPDRDNATLDPTTTEYGLAFSALACHQHLVALFKAICDAIYQCIQSKKERQQQRQVFKKQADTGSCSVAQFVMVLQLLMHLVNRMERSLFQSSPSTRHGFSLSSSGYITPVTPNISEKHSLNFPQSEIAVGSSPTQGSLLSLVQDTIGTLPSEHEKLRQVIQKLQLEIEHSELR